MGTKSTDSVDRFIGARVRTRRMLVGMSQGKLGEALGITFQQIQKYEKGTNRISVSRLHQIAEILAVPIGYFYEGAPRENPPGGLGENARATYETDFLSTTDGFKLMRAFLAIRDARVRRRLVELAKALGTDVPAPSADQGPSARKGHQGDGSEQREKTGEDEVADPPVRRRPGRPRKT
jgi:transcriptional regulator with XRE-family HTH domain